MMPYNEVYSSSGELGPAYRAFIKRTGYDPLKPSRALVEACFHSPLGDQLKVFPVPLVLDEGEYQEILKPGTEQRARAFQHFFRDIVLGQARIAKSGAPMAEAPLEDLFRDQGLSLAYLREVWEGHGEDAIRFVYGPDLIRDSDGRWRIIEDNVGIIGGMSESFPVLEMFTRTAGVSLPYPLRNDLREGVLAFLREAGVAPGTKDVLGLTPYDDYAPSLKHFELDSVRKAKLLEELGIETWDASSLTPAQRERALAGEFSAFVNFASARWKPKREFNIELFKKRRVRMSESPLIKYATTKGFLPYVENMIRFYLNEEPLLQASRTELMREPKLPDSPEQWVIKRATECEGVGVLVLNGMTGSQLSAAESLLGEWMKSETGFIAVKQKYMPPSFMPSGVPGEWLNFLVDLRPTTYVYGFEKMHVAENINARAISALGDPRNCVTRGAMLLPVIREKVP